MVLRDKVIILDRVETIDEYGEVKYSLYLKNISMQMLEYSFLKMRMVYKIDKVYHI